LPKTVIAIAWLIFLAAAVSVAADFSKKKGLSAGVGAEYQLVSQSYYNAVFDTLSADFIETWNLERDEINDFIFHSDAGYFYRNRSREFNLLADLQLSNDRTLGRAEGYYQLGNYDNNIRAFMKFEDKSPHDSRKDWFVGYRHYQAYLRGKGRLSSVTSVNAKVGFEGVGFSNQTNGVSAGVDDSARIVFPSYDYYLLIGQAGGEFQVGELADEISWRVIYGSRAVPDSSPADYSQYRFETGYNAFGPNALLDLEAGIEYRDYAQPGNRDDYLAIGLTGRITRTTADQIELGAALSFDNYHYLEPDVVNRNYQLARIELQGMKRIKGLGVGPVGRLEYRGEKKVEYFGVSSYSEAYWQWEAGLQGDLVDSRAIFFNAEFMYGGRAYREQETLISAYRFVSIAVVGNYSFTEKLFLNVLFDGSFERHDHREDNSSLYLLGVGLSIRL
jgi:hypothetical protein